MAEPKARVSQFPGEVPPSPPPEDRDVKPPDRGQPGPGEATPTPAERQKAKEFLEKARKEQEPKAFEPPEDAELVETTAQGKPAVYQKGKERYYAPGSTMYKMGFRTLSQYRRFFIGGD